jgi:diaminopimelate decarboxylase
MWEQLVPSYRTLMDRGVRQYGLHMMIASNCLDEDYLVDNVATLLKAIAEVEKALGIQFEFINPGGGYGIAYKLTDKDLNMIRIGERLAGLLASFRREYGYAPKLYTEMGRWMTGPYGVLVTRVINRKEIYHTYVGTDIGMEGLARPAFYNAYHRITVPGVSSRRGYEVVSVVGSICENWDRLATNRRLPRTEEGDVMLVQDAGAHAIVMCSHYNGKTLPQEVMLRMGGKLELIRRAETHDDLDATLHYEPKIIQAY